MYIMKTTAMALAALTISLTLGCSEEPAPGPAEKAGAKIDQAVETAGKKTEAAMEKAGNYTGEKLDEAGKAMEHAGEQLKQ
jgi:hypothetical protein